MKILESFQIFIERHTLSFLFFLLGALLIILALTTNLNLPVIKGVAPYAEYRLASLVLGIIFVLLATLLYYLPLDAGKAIPNEFRMSLFERRDKLLSTTQKDILSFIEAKTTNNNRGLQQEAFEQKWTNRSRSETYYRLEQLCLLGFVEKEEVAKSPEGIPRFIYRLSSNYQQLIGRRSKT
ncbi:hypothetical protein [Nostoc cycadae]|uniref:Uncharacterized protein n=1 Tax=Nostoc cycadae WK-1 TaxID=1861711 RepID=A0A2H6LHM0_9NOSO|nr:hypothetical protein [Nostoc cycadae]GBE92673.1 hypothetical protein NCWK1_2431 [Nostoc cycadae WK-1]